MVRLLFLVLMLAPLAAAAAGVSISAVRTWSGGDETRVVFDLSGAAEHSLFTLENPHRVVIDLENATMNAPLAERAELQGVVARIRSGVRGGNGLRLVLDLKSDARAKTSLVRPSGGAGYRLLVELRHGSPAQLVEPVKTAPKGGRDLVIAIDAGHGGRDPGAVGPGGTYEKQITLGVAKKLARLVAQEPGMKPLLIRDDDRYVPLRQRKEKARREQADMFISLHADAVHSRRVQGASVYTLSRRGASTEAARLLAERENAADLVGGVSLDDKDDLVATVLLDLSRAATTESSQALAGFILRHLGGVGEIHKAHVEEAGFVVLKSLDVPSVLVELAFISNPAEERRLRSEAHQWKMARAILAGVRDYRDRHMAPSRLAAGIDRQHVVQAGETLSGIAQRYDVNIDLLRGANRLIGDTLHTGNRLIIPQ
jgi:N-acetylmuramoyl-L-alanine amidase